jgi:hypothetical protein
MLHQNEFENDLNDTNSSNNIYLNSSTCKPVDEEDEEVDEDFENNEEQVNEDNLDEDQVDENTMDENEMDLENEKIDALSSAGQDDNENEDSTNDQD